MQVLIGRHTEKKILQDALTSRKPEMIAVYGRRRVGKTFLIREVLKNNLVFELVGTREGSLNDQLGNFQQAMDKASGTAGIYGKPAIWSQAFTQLTHLLTSKVVKSPIVVFFDELPWLSTKKSGFLAAFDHWWNSWGNKQPNCKVVICGSAASWMIKNVVNNKGGLHNRLTKRMRLMPFTLAETQEFIQEKNIRLDRYAILQLYMILGGIPHYLNELRRGESVAQAIDRICFTDEGLLHGEFKNLYASLFDDATRHIRIVRALSSNKSGVTRTELTLRTKIASGGTLSQLLDELIESGFVKQWMPYNRQSRDAIYKLSDEFTHFYFKFIEGNRSGGKGTWQAMTGSQSWKSWSGIAFERVCLKHIQQLKEGLGIGAVHTEETAWRSPAKAKKGAQIDLLIDRQDRVIDICEMKFSETVFTITKGYAAELENKRQVFRAETGTPKTIHIAMITTMGVKQNDYANAIDNELRMDALFK